MTLDGQPKGERTTVKGEVPIGIVDAKGQLYVAVGLHDHSPRNVCWLIG